MTWPALLLAALLAWTLVRRVPSPRQRAIAWTLTGLLLINVGRYHVRPWPVLDWGSLVAWYAATAWGVAAVLAPERPRTGQLFAVLVASSSTALRLGMTAELGRAAFALALAVQLLAVLRFASRGRWPDDAERAALILAASSAADVAGPWLFGEPGRDWSVGRWPAMLTWLTIAAWEGRCLMRVRRLRGTS